MGNASLPVKSLPAEDNWDVTAAMGRKAVDLVAGVCNQKLIFASNPARIELYVAWMTLSCQKSRRNLP
jgi:hypothetical protein